MADEKTSARSTTDSKEKSAPEAPKKVQNDEPSYTVARLLTDSIALTGQPSHVLAGALSEDDREELTPTEAKAAAEEWLQREVE